MHNQWMDARLIIVFRVTILWMYIKENIVEFLSVIINF